MTARSLGPYRLEGELGRGGQGIVFRAEDTRLSRKVALKVFPAELEGSEWLHAKIAREVELTSRLNDPGVCVIHDTGVIDGRPFLAMRLVEGVTLDAWLAGKPSLEKCLRLLERVARIVHRAHEVGVVHRDLKPANLMVQDGEPVILDFGSAGEVEGDARSRVTSFQGSVAYAAPEQIESERGRPDRRSDVFALGVIAYEVLAGERPFHGTSVDSVFRTILQDDPPPVRRRNPAIPKDLEAVLHTALEKDQDARYQTALDLAEDLRRVRRHEPISIRPAGLWIRYGRWLRRRPGVAGGLTLGALLLMLGIGLSFAFLRENRRALAATRRHSDLRTLPDLVRREAENRWPQTSHGLPVMDAWLAETEPLLARRDTYAGAADPETVAFVRALGDLRATVTAVRERRLAAATLFERTIDAYRDEWARVCAAIADVEANPQYGGLRIGPQEGLVPLGQDPHSGLFEFGHPQSGEVPERNPWSRELSVDHATGFVFVLVPRGTFRMGAVPPGPGNPPGDPNVDPHARPEEAPVHEVPLDAFFLSKYEASELQWERIGGHLFEYYGGVDSDHPRHLPGSFCHENRGKTRSGAAKGIRWDTAVEKLSRLELTLPTEAQMEYATRAGTSSIWSVGNEFDDVRKRENVQPKSRLLTPGAFKVFDGAPNPFGFFGLHGNQPELTLDLWGSSYEVPFQPGDGLRLLESGQYHAVRGGHPEQMDNTRSAARQWGKWSGLRPARALDSRFAAPAPVDAYGPEPEPTRLFEAPVRILAAGQPIDIEGGHAAPALHDLDGDGRRDLLVGDYLGSLRVFRNVGSEAAPRYEGFEWFQAGGKRVDLRPGCCIGFVPQVVDLDGDGTADVLSGSWPGDLHWFRGNGDGTFQPGRVLEDGRGRPVRLGKGWTDEEDADPESLAAAPFAADLDADGDLDLLIGNFLGHVVYVRNDGTRARPDYSMHAEKLTAGGREIRVEGNAAPFVCDWNGDGLLDLLVGDGAGSVWWFPNAGSASRPSFARGIELLDGPYRKRLVGDPFGHHGVRTRVCATDYDGDGDLDLLVGDHLTQWRPDDPLTEEQRRRADELLERKRVRGERLDAMRARGIPKDDDRYRAVLDEWLEYRQELSSLIWSGASHGFVWFYRRIDDRDE